MLVLEWIDGIKINEYAALDAAGINRLEAAKRIAYAYFSQFFEAGFFHCCIGGSARGSYFIL